MINQNSIEVYKKILENGCLKNWRLTVYKYIMENPFCTSLKAERHFTPHNYSTVAARFSELKEMGFIKVVGQDYSEGNKRDMFCVTGRTEPLPILKQRSMREKFEVLRNGLQRLMKENIPGNYIYEHCKETLEKVDAL